MNFCQVYLLEMSYVLFCCVPFMFQQTQSAVEDSRMNDDERDQLEDFSCFGQTCEKINKIMPTLIYS